MTNRTKSFLNIYSVIFDYYIYSHNAYYASRMFDRRLELHFIKAIGVHIFSEKSWYKKITLNGFQKYYSSAHAAIWDVLWVTPTMCLFKELL
jgi:hypothetical protein